MLSIICVKLQKFYNQASSKEFTAFHGCSHQTYQAHLATSGYYYTEKYASFQCLVNNRI